MRINPFTVMVKKGIVKLFALLFVFFIVSSAEAKQSLMLGVLADNGKQTVVENYQPLIDHLNSELLDMDIQLVPLSSNQGEFMRAFLQQQLDMLITNPTHYLSLRSRDALSGVIATRMLHQQELKIRNYGGVIVSHVDRTDINRLEDINGKQIVIPHFKSFGGYQAQLYELSEAGIELSPETQVHSLYYDERILQAVINQQADIGFIRSGVMERLAAQGRIKLSQVKVINQQKMSHYTDALSTRLYPEWPFVLLPHISPELEIRIARALLRFQPSADDYLAGFSPAMNYVSVEQLAKSLAIAPYNYQKTIFLREIWNKYRTIIIIIFIALLITILLLIWLLRLTHLYKQQKHNSDLVSKHLGEIIEATRAGTWQWNVQTGYSSFNSRWAEIVGYSVEELKPGNINTWLSLVHPEDLGGSDKVLKKHFCGQKDYYDIDYRIKHKQGHWVWVNARGRVVEWTENGQPLWMRGTHIDISQRKQLELSLAESSHRFKTMVDNIPVAVYRCLSDEQWTMKYLSAYIVNICGYSADDFIDNKQRSFASIIHVDDVDYVEETVLHFVSRKQSYELEYRIIDANNAVHWVSERGQGEFDEQGNVLWLDGSLYDITFKKQKEQATLYLATHDPLTGLTNRHQFFLDYTKELKRAGREQEYVAILMIDIDYFKQYNDYYGHLTGDECLKRVAQSIQQTVNRPVDIIARYGGEEFIVMLSNTTSKGAETVARLILDRVRLLNIVHESSKISDYISVSIGLACCIPDQQQKPESIIQAADKALYAAKANGRNTLSLYASQ